MQEIFNVIKAQLFCKTTTNKLAAQKTAKHNSLFSLIIATKP